MGGRGDTSKSFNENKTVSNIDAPRNKPFRDARLKEIEAERAAQQAAQLKSAVAKPVRTKKKIIEQKGTVSALLRTDKTDSKGYSVFERGNIESFAQSKDKTLHVTRASKYAFHVTDTVSGRAVATVGSKKTAIKFLKALTRSDGKASPTLKRYVEFSNMRKAEFQALPSEKRKSLSRAAEAVSKLKTRIGYD